MTLAQLISNVLAEDDVTLEAVAHRSGIPLATIGAWKIGTRGAVRPPTADMLRKLAVGLRRPEPVVFEAAGRTYPSEPSDSAERRHLHLYRELSQRDREVVDQLIRALRKQPTR